MSDTSPVAALSSVPGLEMRGEADAMVCDGDVCEVPIGLAEQAVVERLDADRA